VGDVDTSARERFDQWLRSSPENIRAYMEIAKTYVDLPAMKSGSRIDRDVLIAAARADANVVPHDFGMPRSRGISNQRPADQLDGPEAPGTRSEWLQSRLFAASIAVACLAGAIAAWLLLHRYPTYSTEIGENRSITLADGSTIDLNARSRIEIEFSSAERHVDLIEGQALFEVAKDGSRPFIVRSGEAVVRAVGTQFDVDRKSRGTTVTVVEGRVSVNHESSLRSPVTSMQGGTVLTQANSESSVTGATYVSAGEQVTVTSQTITKPERANVAAATAWTQHRLIFEATRLGDVVDDFNRYNTRPLVIDDGVLTDFHVSGVYTSTDPVSFIRFLREQPGVQVIEADDAVHISRR
jgi:transmembrane sensor